MFKYPLFVNLGHSCRDTWPTPDHSYLKNESRSHNQIKSSRSIALKRETDLDHPCAREEIWAVGSIGTRITCVDACLTRGARRSAALLTWQSTWSNLCYFHFYSSFSNFFSNMLSFISTLILIFKNIF